MDFSHIFKLRRTGLSVVFAVFLAFIALNTQASPEADTTKAVVAGEVKDAHADAKKEDEFEISSFIMHHIADSHEWHLWGKTAIHLPVILWTNNGLVTFNAAAFEHDDEAKVVVEANGGRFVKMHEKIYYASATANEHGQFAELDAEHHPTNARPMDFSITKNVVSLFISVAILLALFISVAKGYKKRKGKAPKGLQSFMEPVILFVRDDIAKPNLGHKYERFMPYLLTVFFFIWINNVLGLVPFFPGGANLTGNIAVTMVLALITFIITTVNGNKSYWKHIFNTPGVPWWLKFPIPLMPVVEFVGVFTKPIALMIRLFANITAGHILVLALLCLIFIFKSIFVAPVSVLFVVFIGAIELLVAFIQAFIFTILSALFIGMAIEEHADHH